MSADQLVRNEWVKPERGDALVVVDMQNDFMPGGALAVRNANGIIQGINTAMELFRKRDLPVVMTQDWHTPGHYSFASAHKGMNPFDLYESQGLGPVLWPDHCVQGSTGAEFHENLMIGLADAVIRKGYHKSIDSYSGFMENDRKTPTGLDGYLRSRGVKRIFICGVALDYCVFFTASDGADLGYQVYVIMDLTKPVGSPAESISEALAGMTDKGIHFVNAEEVR
jgi:nicotinamidase/pyrazinamidase